ncbi:MAG: phage tail tape measure protein [Rhodobacteraceae bacterium]|nr:phage tail tape measure protein [Paracoccaceae bacterium]
MLEVNRSAVKFSASLSSGLKSALVDGKSLEGVFRQIALSMSSRLLNASLAPLEQLAGKAASSLGNALGNGLSNLVSRDAPVTPFAKGGVVASPTYFGLSGASGPGGTSGLGVAGEAGAEAILPLARGPDGRLGVAGGGQGAGRRTGAGGPKIQINVATRDAESFRRSEAQVSAMVARAVSRGRRGL